MCFVFSAAQYTYTNVSCPVERKRMREEEEEKNYCIHVLYDTKCNAS